MSVTGHMDGEPVPPDEGRPHRRLHDGMNSSIGILAAHLITQGQWREGQHVDVCLFDTVIASLSHFCADHLVNGETPRRGGTWAMAGHAGRVQLRRWRVDAGGSAKDAQFAGTCRCWQAGARDHTKFL